MKPKPPCSIPRLQSEPKLLHRRRLLASGVNECKLRSQARTFIPCLQTPADSAHSKRYSPAAAAAHSMRRSGDATWPTLRRDLHQATNMWRQTRPTYDIQHNAGQVKIPTTHTHTQENQASEQVANMQTPSIPSSLHPGHLQRLLPQPANINAASERFDAPSSANVRANYNANLVRISACAGWSPGSCASSARIRSLKLSRLGCKSALKRSAASTASLDSWNLAVSSALASSAAETAALDCSSSASSAALACSKDPLLVCDCCKSALHCSSSASKKLQHATSKQETVHRFTPQKETNSVISLLVAAQHN